MQANGGVSEPATAIAVGGGVNDSLPELAGSNSNLAQTQAGQSQQHPQSIRATSSSSSGHHHHQHHHHHHQQQQQQPIQGSAGVGLLQQPTQLEPSSSGVHHRGGYHGQRQPYHGHPRQHHMQHYQQPPHQQQQQQHHHHNLHQHNQHYNHQHPSKYHNNPRGDSESNVNHVLLITVINAHYSITCDLIHQICSTYGKVNRIVIFKKNGVQAMVEFDNVESAKRAKAMLYGCDIYSGCCTLKIEYAKPSRLNIHKNDNDSFDYTNLNLGGDPADSQQHAAGANVDVDHQQQPQNQLPMAPSEPAPAHHLAVHHPNHGSQNHHHGGGGGGSPIGRGGAGGHHMSGHHIHTPQAHPQSNAASSGVGPQQEGYAGNLSDQQQHTTTNDPFQEDGRPPSCLNPPFNPSRTGPYVDSYGRNVSHIGQVHGNNMYSRQDEQQQHQHHHGHHHHPRSSLNLGPNHSPAFPSNNTSNAIMGGPPTNHHHHHHHGLHPPQGTVMMVYGLDPERFNCDRLFNLFCLYGNVVRVKFLKTKEGCAMVQMGDMLAVDWCVSSLNKITLFESELQISYSKQAFLHDVIQPFILPDGSPSFKDFTRNNNNRFKNPEVASKNRILPPSQVLHFFNAPFGITEDELVHLFNQTTGHEPVSVKIFTPKVENSKSYSGLVTFKDLTEATEALITCNHMSMPKHGVPHPYILRLCFSPPVYTRPQQVPPSGKMDMSGR